MAVRLTAWDISIIWSIYMPQGPIHVIPHLYNYVNDSGVVWSKRLGNDIGVVLVSQTKPSQITVPSI